MILPAMTTDQGTAEPRDYRKSMRDYTKIEAWKLADDLSRAARIHACRGGREAAIPNKTSLCLSAWSDSSRGDRSSHRSP